MDIRGPGKNTFVILVIVRQEIKDYQNGKLLRRSTYEAIGKKFDPVITKQAVEASVKRWLLSYELKAWLSISKLKYQTVKKEVIAFIERELELFWDGEIDSLSSKREIVARFNICLKELGKCVKCLNPQKAVQWEFLLQSQAQRGSCAVIRDVINQIKLEMAQYEVGIITEISCDMKIKFEHTLTQNVVYRWTTVFLGKKQITKRKEILGLKGKVYLTIPGAVEKKVAVFIKEKLALYYSQKISQLPTKKQMAEEIKCCGVSVQRFFNKTQMDEQSENDRQMYLQILGRQNPSSRIWAVKSIPDKVIMNLSDKHLMSMKKNLSID